MATDLNKSRALRVCLVLMAIYAGLALRELAGWSLSLGTSERALSWAVRLAPENAAYRRTLGRYRLIAQGNPQAAARELQSSVAHNPFNADSWFDLARAYQIAGDSARQEAAVLRAAAAEPTRPDVAWEAGNFFLIHGENERALREFSIVLANDALSAERVLPMCWRITHDVDTLVNGAIPPVPDIYLRFIEFLNSQKDDESAAKVWSALLQLRQPFEPRRALEYVKHLLLRGDSEAASRAWQQMAPLSGLSSYLAEQNLIVNPKFELDILNEGFDWHYLKKPYITLQLDPNEFTKGSRSLSIQFDGHGVNDIGVSQFIPLKPDASYDFSAYFKTEGMEGAGGPRFVIQDAYTESILYQSDDLLHEASWHQVFGRFQVPPGTKLGVLRILRIPAGNAIRGRLWVDDFSLTEATQAETTRSENASGGHS